MLSCFLILNKTEDIWKGKCLDCHNMHQSKGQEDKQTVKRKERLMQVLNYTCALQDTHANQKLARDIAYNVLFMVEQSAGTCF